TASGTMTVTVSPVIAPGSAGVALGSYSATTSISACGASPPARTTYGAAIETVFPDGTTTLLFVFPGGSGLWSLTGAVDSGVSGLLITGGQVFGGLTGGVTGGVTVSSS